MTKETAGELTLNVSKVMTEVMAIAGYDYNELSSLEVITIVKDYYGIAVCPSITKHGKYYTHMQPSTVPTPKDKSPIRLIELIRLSRECIKVSVIIKEYKSVNSITQCIAECIKLIAYSFVAYSLSHIDEVTENTPVDEVPYALLSACVVEMSDLTESQINMFDDVKSSLNSDNLYI